MGYWENTTYVRSNDARAVMSTLESRFDREQMRRVVTPVRRERFAYEPMQYAPALENDLWGVAVFPGSSAWTVVKTAPLELLSEIAPGTNQQRIAGLCADLGVPAFQVNVYDGTATLLCEVSERGETFISGYGGADDPVNWHGHVVTEEFIRARFRYLPHQDVVREGAFGDEFAHAISSTFGGTNARHCDNGTSVGALISHDHPQISGGAFAYFQWSGASRVTIPACSWQRWDELRKK